MPNYCTYPQALELFQKVDETKQNTLIAGPGINIDPNNTISATGGGSYTAGDGIKITGDTIALDLGLLTGSNLTKAVPGATIKDALDQKQGTLSFDDTPTQNSSNPVKSGGVYSALSSKQNTLTFDNVPTNGSNNPVKSDGIYDALAPKVSESLLNDTVGWVGKNVFPIKIDELKAKNTAGTWSGNTYTHNTVDFQCTVNNGYVTQIEVDGTPTGAAARLNLWDDGVPDWLDAGKDYILSGCPSGGAYNTFQIQYTNWNQGASYSKSDYGSGVTIQKITDSATQKISIIANQNVAISNKIFKPMIRDARITDSTYEPYHKSVEDWYWENNAKTGVHNLLDWKTPTGTDHDVTFTVNSDKTAITPSGTATGGNAYIYSDMSLKAGTYRLLGGISNDCFIQAYLAQSPWTNYGYDYGNGATFTLATDATIRIQCNVSSGKTASGVFYPRIIRAEDTSNAVAPYAMTNAELTKKVLDHSTLTYTEITEKGMKIRFQRKKNVVTISFAGELTEAVASAAKLCDIPSGFRLDMQYQATIICRETVNSGIKIVDVYSDQILANGSLNIGDKIRGSGTFAAQ